jgi:C1A family cysteine protease
MTEEIRMTIQVQVVKAAIESANAAWSNEANFLTAMSRDERSLFLGYTPGPGEPSLKEAEQIALRNFEAMKVAGAFRAAAAPASFDLRDVGGKNYITPVKNQRNCGSCVAFGSAATVEGTMRWLSKQPDMNVDLSEAHLFYCHGRNQGRNCGNGWWVPPALDCIKNPGISDEACYPYTPGDQNCTNLCSDWQKRVVKIASWSEVNSAAGMKDWLSTKGPMAACFTVYDDFFSYKSGIYRYVHGSVAGGHCVCCVGYNDTDGYWICKNSWGDTWGDEGYFKIAYGQCGIDARMWGVEGPTLPVQPAWLEKKLITGLWTINEDRNAAAYIDGVGWRKVSAESDSIFLGMVNLLATAKASKAPTNLRVENNIIKEVYVF